MGREEFYEYILMEYGLDEEDSKDCNQIRWINNILDKAGTMEEIDQYNFLCVMLDGIPERVIRDVYY